jgi:hypothetical protein
MLLQNLLWSCTNEADAAAARLARPETTCANAAVVLGGLIAHPADQHLSVKEGQNTPTVEKDWPNGVNWDAT